MARIREAELSSAQHRVAGSAGSNFRNWCIRTAALVCVAGSFSAGGGTRSNPRQTVQVRFRAGGVSIEYGRPSLRGRDVLKLIEPGQLWRLGADAPTTIETTTALDFGGVLVPKGKHILIVRYIQRGFWSLVFSTAPAIDYVPRSRIAEVLMRFERGRDLVQELEIRLANQRGNGIIEIAWGPYRLSARFVATH
jgi:hypothetical protein